MRHRLSFDMLPPCGQKCYCYSGFKTQKSAPFMSDYIHLELTLTLLSWGRWWTTTPTCTHSWSETQRSSNQLRLSWCESVITLFFFFFKWELQPHPVHCLTCVAVTVFHILFSENSNSCSTCFCLSLPLSCSQTHRSWMKLTLDCGDIATSEQDVIVLRPPSLV